MKRLHGLHFMPGRALERFVMRMPTPDLTGTEAFCYDGEQGDSGDKRRRSPKLIGPPLHCKRRAR